MKEILSLTPFVKGTIWGGQKLCTDYGFPQDPKYGNVAETWMLSAHPDGPSVVQNGRYKGKTLAEALAAEGKGAWGTHNAARPDFPVLIKFIDADDKLSVQVHPDDAYARRVEKENGKTEAWYIISAAPDAELVYGVRRPVTKEELAASAEDQSITEILNYVPVKAGDVAFIPAGTLHAIGKGIFLAEVQQSSNTTYRLYDYNRPDRVTGKPRDLDIEKATDVANLTVPTVDFSPKGEKQALPGGAKTLLTSCEFFNMTLVDVDGALDDAADETSFVSLLVLEGEGEITGGGQTLPLKKGSSIFVPAGFGGYTLQGRFTALESRT